MKIMKTVTIFSALFFVFTSCSNQEEILETSKQTALLKSYEIKRDASGAYSIEFNTADFVKTARVKNHATNTNEFYLSEANFSSSKRQSEELFIDGNKLSIGFIDTNTSEKPLITIEDDGINTKKTSAKGTEMLQGYSISSNEDGTFNLDFNVAAQVQVDFVKNQESGAYEIHLEEGKSSETNFSRVLEKGADNVLKVDFVNHMSNENAKGDALKVIRRKPRVIIENGQD